jgi:hypothetical protein
MGSRRLLLVAVAGCTTAGLVIAAPVGATPGSHGGGGGPKTNLLSIHSAAAGEYAGAARFAVSRQIAGKKSVTVSVNVHAGSAPSASSDDLVNGFATVQVTIGPNQTTAFAALAVVDDNVTESTENLDASLAGTAPRGYSFSTPNLATDAITDDDHPAFVLPADYTLSLTSIRLAGCDALTLGIISDAGPGLSPVASNSGCAEETFNDQAIDNITGGPVTFTIALYDQACDDVDTGTQTFLSDGTATRESVNHASVSPNGVDTFDVLFNDGTTGFSCQGDNPPQDPSFGNASVEISMAPTTP